ncbi:MAG: radical SAM family heme chaperone HemW [Bacteroidales bacterium]|nr:radical SAM family heme chaperone HemW [Bacteroidales bacterium]
MIYIHVPFCHRKCTYCAFYSVRSSEFRVRSYVDALLREMEERKGEQAHPIRTVYFGGGTPSILPIDQLGRIVEGLHRCFDLSQVEEMTLEANPEDLNIDYLKGLRTLGFNRLSIGVQSLDDRVLRMLNRRHTAQQALDAVANAHAAGFENISVDFIYGLPDFSPFTFHLSPLVTHVSAYALTVEPGTALAVQVGQGRVVLPDDEEVVRQYHALHQQLEAAGFQQYEVSNYARPGFESKHNSRYWDRTPYLGLGPGAHSFDGRKRRWNNPDGTFGEETLNEADAYNELLMTSLRIVRGLPLAAIPEGQKERLHRLIQPYIACGWLTLSDYLSPTAEGLLHADGMAAALFAGS